MRVRLFTGLAAAVVLAVGAGTAGAAYGHRQAGPQAGGTTVTPVG